MASISSGSSGRPGQAVPGASGVSTSSEVDLVPTAVLPACHIPPTPKHFRKCPHCRVPGGRDTKVQVVGVLHTEKCTVHGSLARWGPGMKEWRVLPRQKW
jgi:hypothetical protein